MNVFISILLWIYWFGYGARESTDFDYELI